jgi:hypothetical protein
MMYKIKLVYINNVIEGGMSTFLNENYLSQIWIKMRTRIYKCIRSYTRVKLSANNALVSTLKTVLYTTNSADRFR